MKNSRFSIRLRRGAAVLLAALVALRLGLAVRLRRHR